MISKGRVAMPPHQHLDTCAWDALYMALTRARAGKCVDGGVSTPLMTCTTPLVAATSAWMTLAFWTVTDPAALVMWSFCPSRVLTSWDAFRSSARTAAPVITWYSRMASSSLMLAGLSREASVAAGSAAKASLVGAKTVKGPVPESAVTSLPAVSAVTRVDRSGMPAASSTMFFSTAPRVDGGVSTPLMTCTTPLVAATSAWMTLAFWTVTDPAALVMWSFCPSRVLTSWDAFRSSARTAAPAITWYSRMASSSLMLAGLSREGLVGGSEDSEGTSARERGDELASCERSDESRQISDACCEFDNVLLSCAKSRWWSEHTVDDMHNTVGRSDICLDDLGLLDSHRPSSLGDVELLSLEGLDILGCLQVLCT